MEATRREDLIDQISREVLAALGRSPAPSPGPTAPVPPSSASGDSRAALEPFILAPDSLYFVERVVEEHRTIENGFVPIGVSARHCHLSQADLETLFGPGAKLTVYRDLLQKGEFAAEQTVSVIGPRMRCIENVRILGPTRKATQLEMSLTDYVYLGVKAPVRPSGQHDGTPGIVMAGPKGAITMKSGVIRANRHIHLNTADALRLGVRDGESVLVRIPGDRPVIYHDVQIRTGDKFVAEMHLDTDDANAVGVRSGDFAQIIRGYHECRICETCHGR